MRRVLMRASVIHTARTRSRWLAVLCLAASLTSSVQAQAVQITAGSIQPFGSQKGRDRDGRSDPSVVALYGTAFLGPAGTLPGVPAEAKLAFHYVSLHLLFSAAALPQPGSAELKVVGNLRRLNGHVTVEPLDAGRQPIAELAALEVLAIVPDSMLMAAAQQDSGSTKVTSAAFNAITRSLLPEVEVGKVLGKRVGPMVASFTHLFHRARAHTQIAYLRDHREFGWLLYEHENDLIEGNHWASAALEVGPAVRYLRVRIRMVADWHSHGSWQREIEIILDLGAGPSA